MVVKDEIETVWEIKRGASISRFGDGELKLCVGRKQMSQVHSKKIERRLRKILVSWNEGMLIGIPRIYDDEGMSYMTKRKKRFWIRYAGEPFLSLYDKKKVYYSSFITRPDSVPTLDMEYWLLLRSIWNDRDVVLMQGEERKFHRSDLLDNAKSLKVLYGPRRDAFAKYDHLLSILSGFSNGELIILSLGPCATILAHDLHKFGIQALDLGHAGMFYSGAHPKAPNYTGEPYDTDK